MVSKRVRSAHRPQPRSLTQVRDMVAGSISDALHTSLQATVRQPCMNIHWGRCQKRPSCLGIGTVVIGHKKERKYDWLKDELCLIG